MMCCQNTFKECILLSYYTHSEEFNENSKLSLRLYDD